MREDELAPRGFDHACGHVNTLRARAFVLLLLCGGVRYKATEDSEGGLSRADIANIVKKDRLSNAAAVLLFHFIDEDNSGYMPME